MSAENPATDGERTSVERVGGNTRAFVMVGWVCLIGLAVALLLWRSTVSVLAEWSDTENLTYTHGYLILAISVWALIRSRESLARESIGPFAALIPLGLLLSIAWLVAYRAGLLVVYQAILPAAMWLAVCTICGWRIARHCVFAFGFLYFAIPVWSLLNSILQNATTLAMKGLLPVFNVPAYFSGNTVYIPAGVFEIAGGCSGLHFFIVGTAIATLYGEIHRDSLRTRLIFILMAAVLAVLANWVRVFTIIVAGHLTNMQHFLIRVDHYYFGWAVFAVAIVLFLYLASRMPQGSPVESSRSPPAVSAAPVPRIAWLVVLLTAGAFGVGPVLASRVSKSHAPMLALPELSEWSGPIEDGGQWHPRFPHADLLLQGQYERQDRSVEVFAAVYREQHQGKEFGGLGNSSLGDDLKSQLPRREVAGSFGERIVSDAHGGRWVLRDTYVVGTRNFYAANSGQLSYGLSSLWRNQGSAAIGVRVRCDSDSCDAARKSADDFLLTSGFIRAFTQQERQKTAE